MLFATTELGAQTTRQVTRQDDPLVRTLETLYARSMDAARTADLDAYWRYRTRSSRARPPKLTKDLLPVFAEMLPPLQTLKFVRMDVSAEVARALYKWPRQDIARYTVLVYRREDAEWKIDSVTVRTDGTGHQRQSPSATQPRPTPAR
jgi:hypothetical protein